jgi:DNA polymerase III subunit delta
MSTAANLLFLYGNDEYAISRRLEEIRTRHDKEGMNTTRLEARSVTQEALNTGVNAMPFLAGERLVIIAEPSSRSPLPAARQAFLDFLLSAPPSTRIILYEEIASPKEAEKHWLVQRAGKGLFKAEGCFLPRPMDMVGWIVNETKRQGGAIEVEAAKQLVAFTGSDTRAAAQEITKLLIYVNYAHPVTEKDVKAAGIDSALGDIFALVDALGSRQGKSAQKALHQLLRQSDAQALWGMVIRQFRLLLQAREILDGGGKPPEAARLLGVLPFVAEKVCMQAARFTQPTLDRIHHRLLEIDAASKTSQMPLDLALELLVVELTV